MPLPEQPKMPNNPAEFVNISVMKGGRKTVASTGTREALVAVSTPAKWVQLISETDNTGIIVWGGDDVIAALATRVGSPLTIGEPSLWIPVPGGDLTNIYLDVITSGDGCTFNYLK